MMGSATARNGNPLISVVIPVYHCRACLSELCSRLTRTLEKLEADYEIILVNDDGPEDAWDIIVDLAKKDARVKGIKLSRNFGQHYAITAGLEHCRGEWVVVMDCDLQDQPEEIIPLYQKALEGFHIVHAQRVRRKDRWFKKIRSRIFYALLGYLTDTEQDPSIANFGIYSNKAIAAILSMKDHHRYFPTMVRWVGFSQTQIHVSHAERAEGRSAYGWKKLINMAIDIIVSFSDKPLKLMVKSGLFITCMSFVYALYILVQFMQKKILVLGYTSLILSIWFLAGLIIMFLGILGLYIGKMFEKVKGRPAYIIQEKTF